MSCECLKLVELYEVSGTTYEVGYCQRTVKVTLYVCISCGKVQIGYDAVREILKVEAMIERGEWPT